MSASDKKKLRKEQNASKMTERQTQAQKEAKQLKRYTAAFVSIIAIILVVAIGIVAVRGVVQSGYLQNKSVAAVVGGRELSAVELSYYYFDAINSYYSEAYNQYSTLTDTYLLYYFNLDVSKPLEDQMYDSKNNKTWAAYFLETALGNAKRAYLLCDLAAKADYKLSEDDTSTIDSQIAMQQLYAVYYYGYSNFDKYLGSTYCYGANAENYRSYLEKVTLAESYYAHYAEELSYDDEQIAEYIKDKLNDYSSYTYSSVYLSYTYFLGEKQKDENGKEIDYTDVQRDAARAKAKEVAESLLTAKTFEELETAVKALEINKDTTTTSASTTKNKLGSGLPTLMKDWLTNADRVQGDISMIAKETESTTTVDGKEETTKTVDGYYVVIFDSVNDNSTPTVDVHHLLQSFVDDGNDNKKDDDGNVIYTDEEKAKAKADAEALLKEWEEMEGGKTLENFKKLVEEHTDDTSSASTGGLYENISYDQNYVESFLNWCIDENRKAGDVEIIESPYGYHIMYFAEHNEMSYRDLLITTDMRTEDTQKWYDEQFKTISGSLKDLEWIDTDVIIGNR
ncbi:MAG: peptidylprolyl isomerase [Oscillospiraceae bacterium]|nr:peptidylprolyl isomerase [Oscillospiraceae bacterium]